MSFIWSLIQEIVYQCRLCPGVKYGGEGGGVEREEGKRLLQKPRLLHFAPYFNYPSCHFNDQSELGVRFSA